MLQRSRTVMLVGHQNQAPIACFSEHSTLRHFSGGHPPRHGHDKPGGLRAAAVRLD